MDDLAPIVLFVYNRLEHTKKTINALKCNFLASQSKLFIYSDGPKNKGNEPQVDEVRNYIKNINGFQNIEIICSEINKGLSKSIICGVTDIVNRFGKVIVLEDDLITAPYFLKYMNAALNKYQNKSAVYAVTGFSEFDHGNGKLDETFFLCIDSTWTWGTWKEKWSQFDKEAAGWEQLKTNYKMKRKFDFNNAFGMTDWMLNQMERHNIDSWAICWYWTIFKNNGLTLMPNKPLCVNIGFDGSGVHCGVDNGTINTELDDFDITYYPKEIEENAEARKQLIKYTKRKNIKNKISNYKNYLLHPLKVLKKLRIVRK